GPLIDLFIQPGISMRLIRPATTLLSLVALIALPLVVEAQQRPQQERRPSDPPVLRRNLRGVLGGVPMTAADSMHQDVVRLLDFDSYKQILYGLTQFGDREQGTPRNAAAIDWIEDQLRGWGYETERVHYMYTPRDSEVAEPREEVFATKIGSSRPDEMYIIGAHMDGRGGGEAANDDGSGTALVMEIARVLATSDVASDRSLRFALWNNEETGLNGARAYVEQRAAMQGAEDPPGSGLYPEPRWMGMIQHDMMMWDHGNPVTYNQALDADVDVEFQLNSVMAAESAQLGLALINSNRLHATDYPAVLSNAMSNTDSTPFMDLVPAVSLRENRRLYETGNRANPHWHQTTDLFETFSDADFMLGFNAAQTTLGAIARLAEIRIVR
ncbi:MAG: M28 family peptidase, partial [Longimicrobiales bacterium]|nr:M28 family peptidase [Longimicrobiales bacterium]